MAGDDMLSLSKDASETRPLTIIPANGKPLHVNGTNGKLQDKKNGTAQQQHNNNGSALTNGKGMKITTVENGKVDSSNGGAGPYPEKSYDDFDDPEEEMKFGWGSFRPSWLQWMATKQMFLVVFCAIWVLQGMYFTYFVSVITTIEKLFQIQSKTTGLIMSATEIGQIGSSLLMTYFAGQGHRPKWIAWGTILFAVSSFTCSMPHFIFGDQLIRQNAEHFHGGGAGSAIGGLGGAVGASGGGGNFTSSMPANLCKFTERPDNLTTALLGNWSTMDDGQRTDTAAYCEGDFLKEKRIQSTIVKYILAIFFISLLGVGMGQTATYTLGIPYIDDNVASRESPLYFAITIGVRIIGPAMGFMLGSLCTMIYIDLSNPPITPSSPQWIGAWWLGLVLISSMLMLVTVFMFAFPQRLPKSRTPAKSDEVADLKKPSLRDFPKAVKRLLKNDILIFRTASSVLHILPIAGLYTFLPKYLESQFLLAAPAANLISGVGGILVMGLGIILSGVFILKVKPNARFVAGWIAFTAIAYAVGMGILMFVGCPMNDFTGLKVDNDGRSYFQPICDATCDCDKNKFDAVCGADGKTYFSACHAGCSNHTGFDLKGDPGRGPKEYTDCQCIAKNHPELPSIATPGYCALDCDNFFIYLILFSVFVFIHSTGEVGSMLLILRCVDTRDKAMALGLIQFAIGLFGNVPCPIVYGAVVDSACRVWQWSCGERGACWLYDSNVFRMFFHGTTGGIMALAFIVDLIVWYKAGSIKEFVEDPGNEDGTAEEMTNLKTQDAVQTAENEYL